MQSLRPGHAGETPCGWALAPSCGTALRLCFTGWLASWKYFAARPLERSPAHDRRGRVVLAGRCLGQQRVRPAGRGTLEAPPFARFSWLRCGRRGSKSASRFGGNVALRSCHNALRNVSCSVASLASSGNSMTGWPTPLPEVIARDEQPRLAPVASQPLGQSPPRSPLMRLRLCSGPRSSFPPPLRECRPTATRTWNLVLLHLTRTGTCSSHRPRPDRHLTGAHYRPVECVSQGGRQQNSRVPGSTIQQTIRWLASPQLPGGSRALCSAGNARKRQAAACQDGSMVALGLRRTTSEAAPSQTSLKGAAHAPVEHQLPGCTRGLVPLAEHHRTFGGKRRTGALVAADVDLVNIFWQRRVAVHSQRPALALRGGLGLDRVAASIRLRHRSSHGSRLRHQPWS